MPTRESFRLPDYAVALATIAVAILVRAMLTPLMGGRLSAGHDVLRGGVHLVVQRLGDRRCSPRSSGFSRRTFSFPAPTWSAPGRWSRKCSRSASTCCPAARSSCWAKPCAPPSGGSRPGSARCRRPMRRSRPRSKPTRCWRPSSPRAATQSSARRWAARSPHGTRAPSSCSATPAAEAMGQSIAMLVPPERAGEGRRFWIASSHGGRLDHLDTVERHARAASAACQSSPSRRCTTATASSSAASSRPATSRCASRAEEQLLRSEEEQRLLVAFTTPRAACGPERGDARGRHPGRDSTSASPLRLRRGDLDAGTVLITRGLHEGRADGGRALPDRGVRRSRWSRELKGRACRGDRRRPLRPAHRCDAPSADLRTGCRSSRWSACR